MTEPSLAELEAERDRLFAQLAAVGDFRRGSVSENWRKCGKPNCVCAAPDHRGHGPRFLWTRSAGRRKTIGRQLAAAEVEKVRGEVHCATRRRPPDQPNLLNDLGHLQTGVHPSRRPSGQGRRHTKPRSVNSD